MLPIDVPIKQFFDLDGRPLDAGAIYFGEANGNPETAPIEVYWDAAGTQPAAQPIRTINGYPARNGTATPVFAGEPYSITIRDRYGRLVITAPTSVDFDAAAILRSELASTDGASMVGADDGDGGALWTTVAGFIEYMKDQDDTAQRKLGERISVFDYMTTAQQDDVTAGTASIDVTAAIQAAIDGTPDNAVIYFPPGTYKITMGSVGPQDWATEDGDPSPDTPGKAAIAIRNRRNLILDTQGAKFTGADGYSFCFYKSVGCRMIGGLGAGDASLKASANQPSFVLIIRCINTVAEEVRADNYYRGLFVYKSAASGFRGCYVTVSAYFGIYASAPLDVAISGDTTFVGLSSEMFVDNCTVRTGKYGNFFIENAIATRNQSYNCAPSGNLAAHFQCQTGPANIQGNYIVETSNQNSGDQIFGIIVATTSVHVNLGIISVNRAIITNNIIIGCRTGIQVVAAANIVIGNNTLRDFFMSGISVFSTLVSGGSYTVDNVAITGNVVGPANAASTLVAVGDEKLAAIQVEKNGGVRLAGITVVGNVTDFDNRGTQTPAGTFYELYIEGPTNASAGNNSHHGNGLVFNSGASNTVVGTFDRNMGDSSTTVDITGLPFTPSEVQVMACVDAAAGLASWGFSDGVTNRVQADWNNTVAGSYLQSGGACIYVGTSSSHQEATITFPVVRGFRVTWTRVGTPTPATLKVTYIARR